MVTDNASGRTEKLTPPAPTRGLTLSAPTGNRTRGDAHTEAPQPTLIFVQQPAAVSPG